MGTLLGAQQCVFLLVLFNIKFPFDNLILNADLFDLRLFSFLDNRDHLCLFYRTKGNMSVCIHIIKWSSDKNIYGAILLRIGVLWGTLCDRGKHFNLLQNGFWWGTQWCTGVRFRSAVAQGSNSPGPLVERPYALHPSSATKAVAGKQTKKIPYIPSISRWCREL